jgi:hypothetical protein
VATKLLREWQETLTRSEKKANPAQCADFLSDVRLGRKSPNHLIFADIQDTLPILSLIKKLDAFSCLRTVEMAVRTILTGRVAEAGGVMVDVVDKFELLSPRW